MQSNILTDYFIIFGKKITNHITIFGSFNIYFYAIAIVTGMLTCALLAIPLFKRRGENPSFILDVMICVIPGAIIGARLWYVLFDITSFHSFIDVINIRDGGLAIYGGVLGGALGIFVACRFNKVNPFKFFDIGAAMLPLGQAIGRWGNFFNQEVYGQQIVDPSLQFFPLAVEIEQGGTIKWFQALFFYESVLNLIAFAVLYTFMLKYKGKRNGYCVAMYFIAYGTIRGILENFRASEYNLPLFGLDIKAMVLVSILLVVAGIIFLIVLLKLDGKIGAKRAVNTAGDSDGEK